MIYKTPAWQPQHVCVTFELPAWLAAEQIFLVGDFNAWCPTATPLHREADGVWRATVTLPMGSRQEYRYLIDDAWKTDYQADGLVPNPYGTDNSVVCATLPDVSYLRETTSQVRERRFPLASRTPPLAHPKPRILPQRERPRRNAAL